MSPKKATQTSATRAAAVSRKSNGFTAEEKAAMKERSRELKAARTGKVDGESEVLAKIAEMGEHDGAMATRLHSILKASAPDLSPRTWYGMPAYANDDGKVLCFFKPAEKFKARYATLGFSDQANLDDGDIWPTEFALKELTDTAEATITTLVRRALS
jgi:hypothetical protein